ncbi:MAG: LacI family transcriptional regulator [Firmicutes bacterium]|nr:LacI family transcriptional regulator [Bacillota bacterium]
MYNVTISDIAKDSGVSTTTVSRVLNNSGSVSPETRERVLEVIKRRGYSPSATARSLSKRVSSTIGVIVPEVDNPFFGEVLRGITEVIDKNDLTLICCNSDDNPNKDKKALEMLKEHRVRGLVYTPAIDYSNKEEKRSLKKMLKDINSPIVILDREIDYLDLDGVYFDDSKGMYNATKALIGAGHTKIGIINGTLDRVLARNRQEGYLKALKDSGIIPIKRYMFYGDFRMTTAYELSKELLSMKDRPTAVLTCNNRTSMGFLKALYELGESIPENISCIGLDRIEALDIMGINFNYIKRDAREMGRQAIELLINRMAFPDKEPIKRILEAPVVIKKI